MLTDSQDKVYFDRMAKSIGDKVRILEFLIPGSVLDVGAGGGELSHALSEMGYEVTAIDGSEAAISRLKENFPEIDAQTSMVSDLLNVFEENTFDNVVCSSILHEVYSYTPGSQEDKMNAIAEAFEIFMKLLKPGGKLIIRDGVKPDNWREWVLWRLDADYADDFVDSFYKNSPFITDNKDLSNSSHDNSIQLSRVPDTNVFFSDMGSAMEFLYTYTWGMGSADRELCEFYGIMTESEYISKIESAGFVVDYSEQYLQDGYRQFLKAWVSAPLPSSNMIINARKAD